MEILPESIDVKIARIEERLLASEKALGLANQSLTLCKESSNEWRQENTEQRALYVTKDQAYGMMVTGIFIAISVGTFVMNFFNK